MNKSKIKICGIRRIDTLDCCIINKINFFGLIFYKKSPRNISVEDAQALIKYSKNKNISPVGVFVNEKKENLNDMINILKIKYIQLHGDEDNDYIASIKKKEVKIIKNISIKNLKDFQNIAKYPSADMFLFDYKPMKNELPGGNSKSFDWDLINNFKTEKPWFLSGGINVSNIKRIKNYANPYGIDISSGIESKIGVKSNKKIITLMKAYGS